MTKKSKPQSTMDEEEDSDNITLSDNSEDDGIVEALEVDEEPPKKKLNIASGDVLTNKLSKNELYKPPTREEINTLKESETLFHSSLFRLQIDELLSEVRVAEKTKRNVDKWFQSFKDELSKFKESSIYELDDVSWNQSSDVRIPLKLDRLSKKGVFQFVSPDDVRVVGSFPLGLSLQGETVVDVLLVLPKKFFQHDDVKNHRYHRKRAMYLTYLATKLQQSPLVEEMHFKHSHGDTLKPTLILKPKGHLGKRILVQILVSPPSGYFKLSQLAPNKCNVKPSWYWGDRAADEEVLTPRYNHSILEDITAVEINQYLAETVGNNDSIRDGILLLKVWLRQRQLDQGFGSFSGIILTTLVAHLLQTKKLHRLMSSYQVSRITWLTLSQSNWPVTAEVCQPILEQSVSLDDFQAAFEVVFVSPVGGLNLCANMDATTFQSIRHESELALKYLDSPDNFQALFMTPVPFLRKFDHVVRLHEATDWQQVTKKLCVKQRTLDFNGDLRNCIKSTLADLLCKALGQRISLLAIHSGNVLKWSVAEELPCTERGAMTIGFLVDPEYCNSVVDKGPPADLPEAELFRQFWGKRSELRRFKDGSICEAVVWPGDNMAGKRVVNAHITKYILEKHADIPNSNVDYIADQLDHLLAFPYASWPSKWAFYGTGEEASALVVKTLDSLGKQIRSLTELPLTITSVRGVAPSFRYTEVFPPLQVDTTLKGAVVVPEAKCSVPDYAVYMAPEFTPHLDVVLEMERSNKWPDDADAVLRVKAAFNIKLAELLETQFDLCCQVYSDYVDVFKDGFVFRIQVVHKREVTLLKMEHTADGLLRFRDNEIAADLERQTHILPKLTSTIHGLQLQQNTFSAACRLAKRWIACQLLADHVSDIAIELIMVYVYISPAPFTNPRSPQIAFQRFLYVLSKFEWSSTPLIVNLNGELKKEELAEIQAKFVSSRSTLPSMFIATPYDKFTSTWTKNAPAPQVLMHLISLAGEALAVLEVQLSNAAVSDFKQIFRPSLSPYDVIIHLRPKQIPQHHLAIDINSYTKLPEVTPYKHNTKDTSLPVVGYDPVKCYLKDLQAAYGEFAVFFYDKYGGTFIAVLWKPEAFHSKPFKVSNVNGRMLGGMDKDGQITVGPNIEAILADFYNLGVGLVKHAETKSEKWTI